MPEFALFHQEGKRIGIRGWSLLLAGFVLFLDQMTKWVVAHAFMLSESLPVFPGLTLTLRHNQGAAFNFLAEAGGWQRWFFVITAVLISSVIYIWLGHLRNRAKQEAIALSLILGGALGNAWDRIYHGYVVDFILLYYKEWQWPAFNIADSAITLGVCLLILGMFRK